MEENVRLLSCGGCGNALVKVYSKKDDNMDELFIECSSCNSITAIKVQQPKMSIDWNKSKGDGTLCFM